MKETEYKYFAEKVKQIDKEIAPICKAFNINDYGYEIEENHNEFLVLNGQKIGCTGNSISAVIDELIGYIIITRYCRNRSLGAFDKQSKNYIKRYWVKESDDERN